VGAGLHGGEGGGGDDEAVDVRAPGLAEGGDVGVAVGAEVDELGGRAGAQTGGHVGVAAAAGEPLVGDVLAELGEAAFAARAALDDGAREEAGGEGRADEGAGVDGAGGLAEEEDARGVAAEAGGVGLHPREGGDLIPDPVVAGDAVIGLGGELGVDEEAEGAEAIVEGDDDEVVGGGEGGSVVERIVAAAGRVAAAVDEDEDGAGGVVEAGGPGVEGEAVLVADRVGDDAVLVLHQLDAARAEGGARGDAGDAGGGDGGPEAELADRRGGVGDAAEGDEVGELLAADDAVIAGEERAAVRRGVGAGGLAGGVGGWGGWFGGGWFGGRGGGRVGAARGRVRDAGAGVTGRRVAAAVEAEEEAEAGASHACSLPRGRRRRQAAGSRRESDGER
jgi:hypothetical protein